MKTTSPTELELLERIERLERALWLLANTTGITASLGWEDDHNRDWTEYKRALMEIALDAGHPEETPNLDEEALRDVIHDMAQVTDRVCRERKEKESP